MIRTQFPFLEESELYLQAVYDYAKTMTPVEEIPILMDLPPDESVAMQLELHRCQPCQTLELQSWPCIFPLS